MRPNLASLVEYFRRHSAKTAVVRHRGNRRYATTYGELAILAGNLSWFRSGRLVVRVGQAFSAEGLEPAELTARLEAIFRQLEE